MNLKRIIKLWFPRVYIWKSLRVNKRNARMNEDEMRREISRLYRFHLKRDLDWNNLRRYTEKMQWKKIYHIDPLERVVSDKLAVRTWVAGKIGSGYLIPVIGVWNSFEDIDFNSLPDRFVLKTTHASANIFIVKDKKQFDKRWAALMFKLWLSYDYAYSSFELNYKDIPRKIIAEEYMEDQTGELPDYKFMCFDGKPFCCWVDQGRFANHTRDIFDMNWSLLPFTEHFPNSGHPISRPKNYERMIEIATILSQGFSHVRVDLYNIDGRIYFGEMTFCESSGFCEFEPDEYDFKLGDMWHLPISRVH